jgi:hypothetical protein
MGYWKPPHKCITMRESQTFLIRARKNLCLGMTRVWNLSVLFWIWEHGIYESKFVFEWNGRKKTSDKPTEHLSLTMIRSRFNRWRYINVGRACWVYSEEDLWNRKGSCDRGGSLLTKEEVKVNSSRSLDEGRCWESHLTWFKIIYELSKCVRFVRVRVCSNSNCRLLCEVLLKTLFCHITWNSFSDSTCVSDSCHFANINIELQTPIKFL